MGKGYESVISASPAQHSAYGEVSIQAFTIWTVTLWAIKVFILTFTMLPLLYGQESFTTTVITKC